MSSVELMRPIVTDEGEVEHENDLSEAEFDVAVEVGPSSSSKRAATVRALTQMMAITQDPEAQKVLQAAALMNMEGEGLSDIREFFRKQLVQMGVVKPTDEEAAQMAQAEQKPDPNALFLQSAAEEALAKAAKARADVVKTVAESELTQAKTVETLSKVDSAQVKDTLAVMDTLNAQQPPTTPPRPVL
jgi:UDP-N-acetyl-D-mannosaminuronic acid transferase (WecB/TagA/CpsF family)